MLLSTTVSYRYCVILVWQAVLQKETKSHAVVEVKISCVLLGKTNNKQIAPTPDVD